MEPEFPQLDNVQHRFIDLPGLRMHVAEAGGGEPVLLLHGFPQHWWEWRKVIPGLARHYRVICPDLRAAGWTDAPQDGYTRDQLLNDVVALLDTLGLHRVRLIGHDWGALVGFQLCLNHPDRVHSYLCLATPHPYLRFDLRLLTVLWRLWFQAVIATPLLGPRLLGAKHQRFARKLLIGYSANPHAWSEEDIEVFIAQFREPARARAASALYRGFIIREAARIVTGGYRDTRLSTPTQVLYGTDDPGIRPELLGGHEGNADNLTLDYVQSAAHFIVDDQPEIVVERAHQLFL